jgi:hypothetical protein
LGLNETGIEWTYSARRRNRRCSSGGRRSWLQAIAYLPIGCSGDLVQLQYMLDFGLALEERITTGEESCISGGTIDLERDGSGQLTFTWLHPDSDATGHGVLQRVGSSEPMAAGNGSLEIHAATCPPGYGGRDYFNVCHGNGEAGVPFIIENSGMTLPITTRIEESPGPGIARVDGLGPDTYTVYRLGGGPDYPGYVFCSPDHGQRSSWRSSRRPGSPSKARCRASRSCATGTSSKRLV